MNALADIAGLIACRGADLSFQHAGKWNAEDGGRVGLRQFHGLPLIVARIVFEASPT